ncbi:MAG TPA: divalent-cation tolerance protein CutA [Chthoniobacterales bacterium]
MRADDGVVLVYITFPDLIVAERTVRHAVAERLAACGNLLRGVNSIYRWKGAIETAEEVLVLLKTTESRVESLRAAVLAVHPYEVPEFVITPLTGGNPEYLDWVRDCVT